MILKKLIPIVLFASLIFAGAVDAEQKKLGVSKVQVLPSIEATAKERDKLTSLQRVSEAVDGQLLNHLHGTRKFNMIARSALPALLVDKGLMGDALEPGTIDYLVVAKINDFDDLSDGKTIPGIGRTVQNRRIRLGMVVEIYDVNTGSMLESTSFQLEKFDSWETIKSNKDGDASDKMLLQITAEMGGKVANRVTDVIYPAEVVGVMGKRAVINRGDGTGIEPKQVWEIFALGEEMKDSTGASLGRMEMPMGFMTIINVTPQVSYGNITEDYGVAKGCIARPVVETKEAGE